MILELKDFDKIVQKAYSVQRGLIKGRKRFKEDMFTFVALG
jgi:hypothetical protein